MKPSLSSTEVGFPPIEAAALPTALKAVAFWAAVVLPFAILGVLAGGPDTTTQFAVLGGLLAANVLALVVGHDYRT